MLICSCELEPEWCEKCSKLRRHNSKMSKPEVKFMRMVNGYNLPYEEAKKYFTGETREKCIEICLRED